MPSTHPREDPQSGYKIRRREDLSVGDMEAGMYPPWLASPEWWVLAGTAVGACLLFFGDYGHPLVHALDFKKTPCQHGMRRWRPYRHLPPLTTLYINRNNDQGSRRIFRQTSLSGRLSRTPSNSPNWRLPALCTSPICPSLSHDIPSLSGWSLDQFPEILPMKLLKFRATRSPFHQLCR